MELTELKGIGPKTAALLNKAGVAEASDLFHYYPLHYETYAPPVGVKAALSGGMQAVRCVLTDPVAVKNYGNKKIALTVLREGGASLLAVWYNAPYVRSLLYKGREYVLRGKVSVKKGRTALEHPQIFTPEQYAEKEKTLVPRYPLTKGLSNNTVAKAVRAAFAQLYAPDDYLPDSIRAKRNLLERSEAVYGMHFPENAEMLEQARRRIVFDEAFLFVTALRRLKEGGGSSYALTPSWESEETIEKLPFSPTKAQLRAWHEIENDLQKDRPMMRLLQGDVGSGKTLVAFLAMQMAAENGLQAVLLAPTEVLAHQHFLKMKALAQDGTFGSVRPVFLSGSVKGKERAAALAAIKSGEANAVIGTHALLEDAVEYKSLALVVADEQHRFGVAQRKKLSERNPVPHMLVMTATPIPRTYCIACFGDTQVSVLDELPKGRKPIKNALVGEGWRPNAVKFIGGEVAKGRQAYVICPMIEENEGIPAMDVMTAASALRKELPGAAVGVLHGRMKPDEKNEAMRAFAAGETSVLVSTTVVEVGVDVPNATVMLIESAERFGLASLHQLRGRIGRGEEQSYCIFMAGDGGKETMERLEVLRRSNDGFEIAKEDFKRRGPGDLIGIRQSGEAFFELADPARDSDVFAEAAAAAEEAKRLGADDRMKVEAELERYLSQAERSLVL